VLQEAVNEVVVYVATTPSKHFKHLNNKQTNRPDNFYLSPLELMARSNSKQTFNAQES